MDVTLIDWMGSDLTVVNSARVSFDKTLDVWDESLDQDVRVSEGINRKVYSGKDNEKLINYLAKHGHWSPFSHCFLQFRIKAPIFVARQLQKHTVGLAWNEISRRYVDFEPEFYIPDFWRERPDGSVKQGSGGEHSDSEAHMRDYHLYILNAALEVYNSMIGDGVAPEQARMVLPQSMYTEWYWSGSLYAFARVCNQRLDSTAQKESGEIAKGIAKECEELFPVSWEALTKQ